MDNFYSDLISSEEEANTKLAQKSKLSGTSSGSSSGTEDCCVNTDFEGGSEDSLSSDPLLDEKRVMRVKKKPTKITKQQQQQQKKKPKKKQVKPKVAAAKIVKKKKTLTKKSGKSTSKNSRKLKKIIDLAQELLKY
jgi:hypothetical protein